MLHRPLAALLLSTALAAPFAVPASAQHATPTLNLSFLPPDIAASDVCSAPRPVQPAHIGQAGTEEVLSDTMRARYLRRDIARLRALDPRGMHAFIGELMGRLAEVDPDYTEEAALLERVGLAIDAGRIGSLQEEGLVATLRERSDSLTQSQRLILANYYMSGIGAPRDEAYATELIVEAAYAGNADALLTLARMELEGRRAAGWEAPLDITVTMAFGGMLGGLDRGLCRRAEGIARQFEEGGIVTANPDIAHRWYLFAADMGSGTAAWRVVEHHLEADAAQKDNAQMRHYLALAAERGMRFDAARIERVKSMGGLSDAEIAQALGFNHSADLAGPRRALSRHFELAAKIDGDEADEQSLYLTHLLELTELPSAPGWLFTAIGKEILISRGRWAGEAEAMRHFEEAARRGDPEGMEQLAARLIRYRDDPASLGRAADLLTEAVEIHGRALAMGALDNLNRCQAPDAPRLAEANHWWSAFEASERREVGVTAVDLQRLDRFREPEVLARLQSQALDGRPPALADWLQRIQSDAGATDAAGRFWAERAGRSDQALEMFARLELELAESPAARKLAVELFRRVYLNNGVKTAFDLSLALVEDDGRRHDTADEVMELLGKAANRGEGVAIRLISRLLAREGIDPRTVYDEYAEIIEARGDFLALMFAMPYAPRDKVEDYFDRAASLMRCTTKDVDEMGEARALVGDPQGSWRWRQIGLTLPYGHTLSKMRLSDLQVAAWRDGAAPTEEETQTRILEEGDARAARRLYLLAADPDLETWNPVAAAEHLLAVAEEDRGLGWALARLRAADPRVIEAVETRTDLSALYAEAAMAGTDAGAKLELALLMRARARTPTDLAESARLLREAAEAGNAPAMLELGRALAFGLGAPRDPAEAQQWLGRAAEFGQPGAEDLARLVSMGAGG